MIKIPVGILIWLKKFYININHGFYSDNWSDKDSGVK